MPDTYIENCIKSRHNVNIIMINGFVMAGKILEQDENALLVLCGKYKKLVYKHGISTIEPRVTNENSC